MHDAPQARAASPSAGSHVSTGTGRCRVGFPRALIYYLQSSFWRHFVSAVGGELVLSPRTGAGLWDEGLSSGDEDLCLPVRVYLGHAAHLAERTDLLLAPRLVGLEAGSHMCPFFLGLPDLVRSRLPGARVVDPTVRVGGSSVRFRRELRRLQRSFVRCAPVERVPLRGIEIPRREGYCPSLAVRRRPGATGDGSLPEVAVLGHPYLVGDDYLNMGLLHRLHDCGVRPVCIDQLDPRDLSRSRTADRPYWSESARMLDAARHFVRRGVEGVIHVSAFNCGCDSFVSYRLQQYMRERKGPPPLQLVLDEHSGEAGIATRVEAYCDMMLRWSEG